MFLVNFSKKIKMMTVSFVMPSRFSMLQGSFIQVDFNQIFTSRITDFSTDGGSGRFELWGQALNYFMAHPLFGIGAFNFSDYYAFDHNVKLYVHNTYLEVLVESGIIGFLFYCSFLVMLVIAFFRTKLHKQSTYIVLTLFAFLLQMVSLSLMINEAFFIFLALAFKYISVFEKKELNFMMNAQEDNIPLVSIITPSYNSSTFIKETIESVHAQSYPHWEMIIVDDKSKDDSVHVIKQYVKNDPRIKLISLTQNVVLLGLEISN